MPVGGWRRPTFIEKNEPFVRHHRIKPMYVLNTYA